MRDIDTDYLVIGAGAMGMAFVDALIDHAQVHVTLVDRRHAAGGHWRDAYPFVRLHQASVFYGVDSTQMGGATIQQHGPERGLHERAGMADVLAYYDHVLERRFLTSREVTWLPCTAHTGHDTGHDTGDAHVLTSLLSGERTRVRVHRRVVDATYLSPTIPATTPPPFGVADGARVATINQLATLGEAPACFVIVGSGKTATDAIVWLLAHGVDPDRIAWVRPRDPWMLDRSVIQPDPVTVTTMVAATWAAAAAASDLDDMFLRLEDAGVMLRIDPDVVPTMARTPTLGRWELDLLRTVERVVRKGHIREVRPGELVMEEGTVPLPADALVVHCAASGLVNPPLRPVWEPDRIRLQTSRVGAPCFCAALAGYLEATCDDDSERNRLAPPNLYGNTLVEWARMTVRGARAVGTYMAEDDVASWADTSLLNPSRVDPAVRDDPALQDALGRAAQHAADGLARLAEMAGEPQR